MSWLDNAASGIKMSNVFKSLMKGEECAYFKRDEQVWKRPRSNIQVFQSVAEAEFVKTQNF